MKIVNPKWKEQVRSRLDETGKIDHIESFNQAVQWLIEELTRRNKKYKIYQLGAGVKRITTDTDTCPCCKRPL